MRTQRRRVAWMAKASLWLLSGLLLMANLLAGGVTGQEPVRNEGQESQTAPIRTAAPVPHPPGTGFIPPPMDLSHLTGQQMPTGRSAEALPAAFDWRDVEGTNYVTPVKDQGSCGSCYAFGALGSFESKLLIDGAGTWDLSENHAKECNWKELNDFNTGVPWGSCDGGNSFMIANLYSQTGSVLESCDPYVASDVACNTSCAYQQSVLDFRIISGSLIPSTEVLKQYIYDNGPVITSMYADTSQGFDGTYDGSYTFNYTSVAGVTNHSVLIVGWSDELPHVPEEEEGTLADGWIVKNSWGTGWGDSGYFYITYGAANIGYNSTFFHDWQNYEGDGELWFYDEDGWNGSLGQSGGTNPTAWILAKYIPDSNTNVTRVEFWATDVTTDVDVYLYDDFDSEPSNVLASKLNSSFGEAGYHSVAFDSPVAVTNGDDVYAVVKVTNASYGYPIAFDSHGTIQTGVTYRSYSGLPGSWGDTSSFGNATVRVRTDAAPGPTVTSITPNNGENTGVVSITDLAGDNFQPGATVKLVRVGQPDIDASDVIVVDSTQLTCDFDLTSAATGAWDIVVTNPDAQSGTLSDGFVVYTSVPVSLSLGWNLISLQLEPLDPTPEEVLSSIAGEYDQVFAYEGCDATDPWKRHAPGEGENDLTAMGVEGGYWVHTTSSATLTLAGALPTPTAIPLCTGWNLVGYPSQTARLVTEALASIDGSYSQVQTFDPSDPADPWKRYDTSVPVYANDLALMEPGKGYWIYVTTACTLGIAP